MSDSSKALRRRRGRDFVTQNACKECKRKKAKCDGQNPCTRCSSLDIACEYGIPVHVSKSNLRTRIKELETRLQYSEHIFRSLSKETHITAVLRQLKEGDSTEKIYQYLASQQAADNNAIPDEQKYEGISVQSSEGTSSVPTGGSSLNSETPEELNNYPTTLWTTVTTDSELVKQLHSLYFSWEHAVCSLFSKDHFVEDRDSGRHRYCSPLLVNIIAALGCKFSTRVEIREVFDEGEKFYMEAEKLWQTRQDETSITTIQATALMSLWEAGKGQHRKGAFYSRQALSMAIEGCFHNDSMDDKQLRTTREVRSATFWGIFTLDQIWSLYSGCLPHLSRKGSFNIPFVVTGGEDQHIWAPYFDDGALLDKHGIQPSNVRSVFRGICELTHLMYGSLYILYTPGQPVTVQDVMGVYHQYLEWYESMLLVLKNGENSTPMAIFAHLLFRFGILLLFSPLIGPTFEDLSVVPDKICAQSADTISSLIRSHRELYSLRRIHAFIPYISLVSSVAYLAIIKTQGSRSIVPFTKVAQGISDLRDMAPSSNFAGRAANALQKIMDRTITGADPLSDSSENQLQNVRGATYSLGSALGFSAHRIFDLDGAPSSPLFSSFLSWVMTEVRDKR